MPAPAADGTLWKKKISPCGKLFFCCRYASKTDLFHRKQESEMLLEKESRPNGVIFLKGIEKFTAFSTGFQGFSQGQN